MAGAERRKAKILESRKADDSNAVLTISAGTGTHRREPCPGCPWRRSNAGSFPAEAFRISAHTAYDGAMQKFGCHESGSSKPATCAGFLLRNSENNVGVRLSLMRGEIDLGAIGDPGDELFDSYSEMAVANGVEPEDEALARCRADYE